MTRRPRTRHGAFLSLLALAGLLGLALVAAPAAAQPMADPGDDTRATELKLKPMDDPATGKWARVQVRLPAEGRRFWVGGLDVMAPLSIQVAAEDPGLPVAVSLHRFAWGRADASGDTGDEGIFRFDGRAHARVGVLLKPGDGRPARATLLVWQGPAQRADFLGVVVPPEGRAAADGGDAGDADADAGAGTAWTTYAILAVLAVIAALLGVLVLRRGRGAAAVLLAVFALSAGPGARPALAADDDKTGSGRGDTPEQPKIWEGGQDPDWQPEDPALKPDAMGDGNRDKDKDLPGPDKPGDETPGGGYRERIDALERHVRELHERTARDRAELERLRLLVEEDRENQPDPSRLPPMPLSCRPPADEEPLESGRIRDSKRSEAWAAYDDCQRCYAEPLADLDRQLELYERLRILYSGAKTDLAKMIAAGDMAPKPHYMVDSAWQAQKQKINIAFQGTQAAYDGKHAEFRDRLTGIVDQLGRCEAEHNGNPMWRETSGKLFIESISASYRRND